MGNNGRRGGKAASERRRCKQGRGDYLVARARPTAAYAAVGRRGSAQERWKLEPVAQVVCGGGSRRGREATADQVGQVSEGGTGRCDELTPPDDGYKTFPTALVKAQSAMKLPIDGSSRRLFLATSAAALFASPSLPALADTAAPTYSLKVGSRQLRDAQSHKHADVPLLILRECLRNAWLMCFLVFSYLPATGHPRSHIRLVV